MTQDDMLFRVVAAIRTQLAVKLYALLGMSSWSELAILRARHNATVYAHLDDAWKSLKDAISHMDLALSELKHVSDN